MIRFLFLTANLIAVSSSICPSNNAIDVTPFSDQLQNLRKVLGGHTDVDLWFPQFKYGSPFGQVYISDVCDLECYDFDSFLTKPCRWRNEKNSCEGDEMDFLRMRGRWDKNGGGFLFSKQDSPDGFFLIVGTDKKLHSEWASAMLVSDPIQCQEGDGTVSLRYWASPAVRLRVCIRRPSKGKVYDWCSEKLTRNGTQSAKVVIPGSIMYSFEIVIEAYNFTFDTFGKKGGMAVLDDISYNSSSVYKCQNIPHFEPLSKIDRDTCRNIQCHFNGDKCVKEIRNSGWKVSSKSIGSHVSGIRTSLEGDFAYARGPGTYSFQLGPLTLERHYGLEFCFYTASFKAPLKVHIAERDQDKRKIFDSSDKGVGHEWQCDKIMLSNGTYDYIEFSADKLPNEHIYVGVDQIDLIDPIKSVGACDDVIRRFDFNFFIN